MTLILFIVGLLLIALGWHIGSRPTSSTSHDDSVLGDAAEGALAVFSMFVGGVFALIALLSWAYHWMHA